jgi:hypothetical protein
MTARLSRFRATLLAGAIAPGSIALLHAAQAARAPAVAVGADHIGVVTGARDPEAGASSAGSSSLSVAQPVHALPNLEQENQHGNVPEESGQAKQHDHHPGGNRRFIHRRRMIIRRFEIGNWIAPDFGDRFLNTPTEVRR